MPGRHLIDAGQVARFRADLERLTYPDKPAPVGVAVSGGSDSLALLLLAHAAFPGEVRAATVNHGLRSEAAAEAAVVAGHCAALGIPHATLRTDAAPTSNLQAWARGERYRLLSTWAGRQGSPYVLTAHHRDDVAEGFLMQAARGGGVRSLAAMPAVRALDGGVLVLRPLLDWTRDELAAVMRAAGIDPAQDPSNEDHRFDRVRIRRLLAATPALPPAQLARAAANLRDVEEAMEWLVGCHLDRLTEAEGGVSLDPTGLPFEVQRRLVLRAIETVRGRDGLLDPWRPSAVAPLVRALAQGAGGAVADVQALVRRDRWLFRPAPPRRTG